MYTQPLCEMKTTCVLQCTYMSDMDLVTYVIMSTVSISIVGQIQGTQHHSLLVNV